MFAISQLFNRRNAQPAIESPVAGIKYRKMNQYFALNKKSAFGHSSFNGKPDVLSLLRDVAQFIFSIPAILKIAFLRRMVLGHDVEVNLPSLIKASKPDHGLFPALLPMKQVFLFFLSLFRIDINGALRSNSLLFKLCLAFFLFVGINLSAQQTVSWRTQAANGNWENGNCNTMGTANSQWWYAGFTPNNSRNRPDCNDGSTTRHNVEIANNHQTTMSLNTAFWGLRSFTLTSAATSSRTFNGSPDDVTRGISLTNGLYNNSNSGVTHNFNVRIGIDASPCTLRTLTAGATTNYNREIFGNSNAIVFDGSGATNSTAVISGAGASVSKQGSGTLTISGNNTYAGNTTISAGTLQLGAANTLSNSSNMVLSGGTFRTGATAGFSETAGTLQVTANSTIALGTGSHDLNFAASSAESWTSGTLLTITGWTGTNNGSSSGTAGRFFVGNSASGLIPSQLSQIVFNISSTLYSAVQLSTGEVVPSGSTPLYFSGATAAWNTSNWSTNNAAPYTTGWTNGRHAIFNIASTSVTGATVNFPRLTANANVTISTIGGTIGTSSQNANITVANGVLLDFSTQSFSSSASFGITKNGPGTMALAGNTYGGGFTLNAGTVVARGINAMGGNGTPGALNINGGTIAGSAARDFSGKFSAINVGGDFTLGSSAAPASSAANLTFNAGVALGSSATRILTMSGTGTYALNGVISGTGSNLVLNATAAGTLSLRGANTYGGNTTINGGTLLLTSGNNRLPVTTNLTLANTAGATFNLGDRAQTIASLSGGGASGGNIVTGGSTGDLTVNQTTSTTYAGVMSGTGDLIKTGNGVLTLSGANTYSGVTTLSAGTLLVNGSTASTSAVTVSASATLGGSGTTAGTVALNGTVAPGSAATTVGTLNTGAFTFNPASSYRFDISNVSGTAGTNWDLLASSGQIGINSSSASRATIFLTGNPSGFNSCTPYTWRIAQGSSISSFDATKFTINTTSFTPAFVGAFSLQQNGNAIDLVYTGATLSLTSAIGTNAQLRCINTAITNITYATTGATGATVTGLPAGVTSNWASNVLTISGTPTAYGLYTYTVTLTGTCSSVSTTGTLNVNGLDYGNLQFPGTQTICLGTNFTAYGQVFEPGITEAAGANVNIVAEFGYNTSNTDPSTWPAGNWSATSYSTQSGNNDEYRIDFGSALASGTYYYTFRYRINGCSWQYGGAFSGFWNGTTQPSGVLTVSPVNTAGTASSTPTLCINTALTNITRTTTGATGIGAPTGLPAGVTAAWAANVITISGTPTASGTFNYSIPLTGGCSAVNATGTITVNALPVITTQPTSQSVCGNNTATFNIATSASSPTYQWQYNANPVTDQNYWDGLGNIANNQWNTTGSTTSIMNMLNPLSSGWGPSYSIRCKITAGGCTTISNAVTITVNTNPTVTGSTPNSRCGSGTVAIGASASSGATIDWYAGVSGGSVLSGGTAATSFTTPSISTTTSYFAQARNTTTGCLSTSRTGVIATVSVASVGGTIAGSASKCANNAATLLTLSGYTGSIVKWQSSTSSTFASAVTDIANTAATYTTPANLSATTYYRAVITSGVCASVNSGTATITIRQPGSGNFAYSNYGFCTSTAGAQAVATSNFTGPAGLYSRSPAGLVINGTSGEVTPSTSTAGTYVVTYTIPASGGCAAYSTTTNVTIDRAGSGSITYSPSSMCTGTAGTVSPVITGAGGTGASTWFIGAPGTIAMDANGVITPSTSAPGTYTITYNRSSTGLCPAYSSNTTVTINASPTISSSTPGSRCGTGSVLLGATSSTGTVQWWDSPTGGTFLASGNTYNTPAISGTTTYYADPLSVNGCVAATRTAILATVLPIPTITATNSASVCGTGVVALSATASAGTISWFTAATGGTAVATGNSYSPTISSTTTYYVEATSGGCTSASRTAVTGTVNPIPTITATTPGATCGTGTVVLGATASAGTLSWFAASTGGTSLGSGTSFTTPSISSNTTYYVEATNNGCTSARSAVLASVVTSPSISSVSAGTNCGPGSMTLSVTPSAGASITWYSVATGGTSLGTGNSFTTPVLSSSATYYAQASVGSCTQPSRTAVTATIYPIPVVDITADYCSVGGKTVLTATGGMLSYTWNTGATTQSIEVDMTGRYKVTVLSTDLCVVSDSLQVATELVLNGGFNSGNSGFTTNYTYVADGPGSTEMYPEGTYAIVPNPNTVHNMFYGKERNGGNGNIMVINGSPALGAAVWNQNNTTVLPNTTYYFSAWAMSVVNGNNAILQFSINGSQVGTIGYLPNGYTNTSGPYTWVRFFGQWNSGPATSANLSIVNLNTILGGNDFALDDISFGTLSPIALSVSPIINSGTSVCQNDPLVLNAGASGGASPFSYSWTGPNGFTSTDYNPVVTAAASSTQNGTYTVVITDGFGCQKTANVTVSVSSLPASQTLTASSPAVCSGGSTNIVLSSSEVGVYYQLRNNATDANIGSLMEGTGSSLSLPTGVLLANTTFKVLATRFPANCDREMSNTITVSISVTPELNITNQAACSGTVDLTAASVTAGSTGSGTLTYWTTIAATTAVATPTAVGSGTYFIRSTNGSCSDIEPVVVSISATPSAAFTYSAASYCTSGLDPIATVTGTSGVFSSVQAGLVFVNTNTGEIDLSASTPGTYTVRNTVTPTGACSPVSQTQSVTITAAPLAGFNYVSNDLCQSANALNASPIFDPGASAGTFSTSAGLSLNTSSGVINVAASTPGNYAIVNTRAATGGCPSFSDTTFLDINPYIFTGAVSSSVSEDVICQNETVDLYSSATSYATVLLRERFNGTINNWVRTNSSTGGTPANAAWTLRPDQYNSSVTYRSNDQTQFYLSDSRAQGSGGTTLTYLRSPAMSTIGFSTLSLDFFHFFDARNSDDIARVQVSTNNTTWTDLLSYTTDQGSQTGFTNAVVSMNAYVGLPTVYIRFFFTASNDRYWAIDNVSITGNSVNYGYSWTSSPVGYSSNLQNPTAIAPTVNTFYTVTATNSYGCSNPNSPVPVTVNPIPADNAGTDQVICGSGSVSLGATATAGNTYSWSPSATLSSATVAEPSASPTSTTTYILTETITATGCSDTNAVKVTVSPLPVILSTTPGGRCGTGTVVLSASSSTGTMKWFANPVGGTELSSSATFTTPSISVTTTYFVEATSASCNAVSRKAVQASINASPTIASQVTPAATYSQFATATAMSVTANAGSGTVSGYQWFFNPTATTTGGTSILGANSDTYIPSTAVVGTLYYFCEVTNSNGCTVRSAVSGAVQTLLSPQISSVTGTLPSPAVAGQLNATGYRGQELTIAGANFASNATVTINGVAATVTFVNSNQLTVIVNNSGANSTGNMVVTNPSTGAFVNQPFQYIGYITTSTGFDFNATAAWLGGTVPTAGSDVTFAHSNTVNTAVGVSLNQVTVATGCVLTFPNVNSTLTIVDLVNKGTVTFNSTGTLNISGTMILDPASVFNAGNGTVVYNKAGNQQLFSGKSLVTYNNVNLAGTGNKSLAADVCMISKNLVINSGVTFNVGNTNAEILMKGDLTINGNVTQGTSDFHFIGTTDQSISANGTGTAVFSSMNVNKPSGTLNLNNNVQIQDSLILTAGNINTQTSTLEIGFGVNNRGTLSYTSGYVSGKLKRWFASATNSGNATGLFPMGQIVAASWKKRFLSIEYTMAPTAGGSVTVEFMPVSMLFGNTGTQTSIPDISTGGAGFEVGKFSDDGYWKVDNEAGTLIDGEYTIKATAEEFMPLAIVKEGLTLVKRVGGGDWFCPGTHLAPVGDLTTTTLGRSGVSGYSNYGFAGQMDVPLSIELAGIQVNCTGFRPTLSWTTAREVETRSFIIQESSDGKNWNDLATVSAAKNSTEMKKYNLSLDNLNQNSNQVRLVLINENTERQNFNSLNIPCGRGLIKSDILVYPNPSQGMFVVDLQQTRDETLEIAVLNIMGQNVYGKLHNASRHSKISIDLRGLPAGMYQVVMSSATGESATQNFKVVVK